MTQTLVTSRKEPNAPRAIAGVLLIGSAAAVIARGFQYYFRGAARHYLETAWMWFLAAAVLLVLTGRARRADRPLETASAFSPMLLSLATIPAALVLYWPAMRVGLLSDDFVLLARAARNDFFHGWTDLFRPVPLLIFRAVGARPLVLHALNIGLHGLNAALVIRLARRYGARRAAAAAGALFLTFPASVEAVVWCSGLQDVLMTTLTLATIDLATTHAAWPLLTLTAALLTKETAVAAPVLVGVTSPRRIRAVAAGSCVALVYVIWRTALRPLPDAYALRPSAYAIKEIVVRAFGALAVPVHSTVVRTDPWIGLSIVCAFVALVVGAAWRWRESRSHLVDPLALLIWILASVAPVYSYFFITDDLAGSRYLYLASAGWSVLLTLLLVHRRSRPTVVAAILLCVVSAVGTRANVRPWIAAAAVRDEVVAAVRELEMAGCASVWVADAPDSVEGAYVFRNGLAEAVSPAALDPAATPDCRPPAQRIR